MTVPQNEQQEKFPNDPIFNRLLSVAQEFRGTVIYDTTVGIEVDYARFLSDVSRLRATLRRELPQSAFNEHGLVDGGNTFINVLSVGGYEFIVSFYAILSIGGACVPLATGVLPEEAEYFMQVTDSNFLLVGRDRMTQATKIKEHVLERAGREIILVSIPSVEDAAPSVSVGIDDQIQMAPTRPAVAVFTSGTTGRPKAVVLPRERFYSDLKFEPDNVLLAYRPQHWIGGLRTLVLPLLNGSKVQIVTKGANPEVIWKHLRDKPLTELPVNPVKSRQLKEYFQQHLSNLPKEEVDEYIQGLRRLKWVTCSGGMIEEGTVQFWKDLLGNIPFINSYALTETGLVAKTRPDSKLKNSIGVPIPGVSIKLSQGDHGEALVKARKMFSRYLGDEEATKRAFDEEGYFRTGDLLRRVGDEYVFEGRAKSDFILFYGYRISIPELEHSLMSLPYIAEAYVIAAPSSEARELAAAIVRLKNPSDLAGGSGDDGTQISLRKIRSDLSSFLATHKLPAILRVLRDGESVSHTAGGKTIKRGLLQQFFNITGPVPLNYSEAGVEYWGNQVDQSSSELRPWDWCGLQHS